MAGSFPPSSRTQGIICSAAARFTFFPVAMEPVNTIIFTPLRISSAPTSPLPCTTAEEPARQAGLLQQGARLLHHNGGELARLHHHPVAGHERGDGVADRDREGIVPGRDDADHSPRVETQVRLLVGEQVQRDLLVGEHLLSMGRVPVHCIRDRQYLHEERLVARLPVLPRDVVAEVLGAGEQQLLEPEQHGAPFCEGLARPLGLRRASLLHGLADVGNARDPHLPSSLPVPGS